MKTKPCIVVAFAVVVFGAASVLAADKPETAHLAFVTEYIRQLAAIEEIRASAEKNQQKSAGNQALLNAIHSSTQFQLELGSQVGQLKHIRLVAPFETLIPSLVSSYEEKIKLHQRIIDISTTFLSAQKPNIDYGKLAAEMPEITARLDYVDQSLFDATPLVFMTLINEKPDSKNHVSHLIITKGERANLINVLNNDFGSKLEEKDPNYTVGAAMVLRDCLLKDYKGSDDPWE